MKAPKEATRGDFIYVKIESAEAVSVSVSIGTGLTSARNTFCWLEAGDLIVVKHPDSVFLSFTSQGASSGTKIIAFFSETYRENLPVANFDKCSDYGASLSV